MVLDYLMMNVVSPCCNNQNNPLNLLGLQGLSDTL